jgi:hypothetical protein
MAVAIESGSVAKEMSPRCSHPERSYFQARFEWHRNQWAAPGDVGLAIDVGEQALDPRHARARCVRRLAGAESAQVPGGHPAGVVIGSAHMQPSGPRLRYTNRGSVDRLRHDFGVVARLRVHIGGGFEDDRLGRGGGEEGQSHKQVHGT